MKMNNKFVRLSKHSFVRIYDEGKLGYILNQRTGLDRVYDDIGADFLFQIERVARSVTDIVSNLLHIYTDASKETILNDFLAFIEELSRYKFVVISDAVNQQDNNEIVDQDNKLSESLEKEFSDGLREKTSHFFWSKHDVTNPILRSLHIELTGKCNERCVHCFIPNSNKETGLDMSFEQFKSVIDQFREMGGLNVTLSGGEPLLNKNISDMLTYCRQKDLCISLFTNLLAFNDNLIQVMRNVNLSNVQVSLYSTNASVHNQITQTKGAYEKTILAIEKLKKNGIPVSISCPLMKANKETIEKLMKYARSRSIPVVMDNIIIAQSDFGKSNLVNRLSLKEMGKALRDMIENDVDPFLFESQKTKQAYNGDYSELPLCSAANHTLCISANGNVSPCAVLTGMIVGNINRQSLNEIWNTSEQLKYIRSLRQKHFQKCLSCDAKRYCKMCIGQNFCESGGNVFEINQYFCDVAFLTKHIVEEWRLSHSEA